MRKPRSSEWKKGKHDPSFLPSLMLVIVGMTLAVAGYVALNMPQRPIVQEITADVPTLETYCYAYGGLYGLDTYWQADTAKCFQEYEGQFYPVAYQEIVKQ